MIAINPFPYMCYEQGSLNPVLVAALQLAYPTQAATLVVTHAGQHRHDHSIHLHRREVESYGEEIKLNCPFCQDTRGRMQINHSYDPVHHPERWFCYNETCHKNAENRARLASRLKGVWANAKGVVRQNPLSRLNKHPLNQRGICAPQLTTPVRSESPELPEGTTPIINFPNDHPAVQYLLERGYNPGELWDNFQVGFTEGSTRPAPAFGARLVIPIVDPPVKSGERPNLLGWQARQIPGLTNDSHENAKYLTMAGYQKSKYLYSAVQGPLLDVLYVVEGVTDVWRIGRSAVALLGKTASPQQIEQLVQMGQFSRQIYVALDRDAQSEQQQLVQTLRRRLELLGVDTHVLAFELPDGRKDIGECQARDFVMAEGMAVSPDRPPRRPVVRTLMEPSSRRFVSEPELSATLITQATGNPPSTGEDLSAQLQQLGMSNLYDQLELPLQSVLREIELRGVLIDQERLRTLVCQQASLASKAAQLKRAISPVTGRVYTQLDSLGTKTGRITASNYPLQSLHHGLRAAIVAGPGKKLIYADYGQFEWRIVAALSGDPLLLSLFLEPGFDLYSKVSAQFVGVEHAAQIRESVKQQMMAFLFSPNRLAPSTKEGQAVSQFFSHHHPRLLAFLQALEQYALDSGRVRTPFGRRVQLPQGVEAAQKVVNYLVQATAADLFKYACLAVDRQASRLVQILLPLHDALLVECEASDVCNAAAAVIRCMEMPISGLPVRLTATTTILDHWK